MRALTWMPWRRVEDALPDSDETVMIANRAWSDPVWLGYHDGEDRHAVDGALLADDEDCESEDLLPPTHWMPMPEPPLPERRADDPPLLALPAPRSLVCRDCGLDGLACAIFDGVDGEHGLYFVEHDSQGLTGDPWHLCDECEAEWQTCHHERSPYIWLDRGTPAWHSQGWVFEGFEQTPLVCVTDASSADHRAGREHERETWLYCRNRDEWRAAWAAARWIVRDGFTLFRMRSRGLALLDRVAAYKPPGTDLLTVNTWKEAAR